MKQLIFLDILVVLKYATLLAVLYLFELLYFRVALKLNIVDVPNGRSSHNKITLRGGGIIFWASITLSFIYQNSLQTYWLLTGVTLVAVISFWDDIKRLDSFSRLSVHFLSTTCVFIALGIFNILPLWAIIVSYFAFVAILNVYNFMDGINGLTGLYSIAVLGSLQYVNFFVVRFVSPELIWFPIAASVVFLFFNFRSRARCFAGDVGSISMGFWIVSLLTALMLKTQSLVWLGFLMVYGIDGVGTILHRIYLGDNILRAHRIHLFQILANEKRIPQRVISAAYFVMQVIVSILLISSYSNNEWYVFGITLALLTSAYLMKFKMMKQIGLRVKRSDTGIRPVLKPVLSEEEKTIA